MRSSCSPVGCSVNRHIRHPWLVLLSHLAQPAHPPHPDNPQKYAMRNSSNLSSQTLLVSARGLVHRGDMQSDSRITCCALLPASAGCARTLFSARVFPRYETISPLPMGNRFLCPSRSPRTETCKAILAPPAVHCYRRHLGAWGVLERC